MKTLARVLVPLVLVVFIVAPGITGFWVESEIVNSREHMAAALRKQDVQLLDSSFRRGWFGSDQTAEFSLSNPMLSAVLHALAGPEAVYDLPTLLIETRATHGVLPMTSPSKGGLRPAVAQTRSQLYLKYPAGQKAELPIELYTSLGVSGWAKLLMHPITRQIVQNGVITNIDWTGAAFQGSGDFEKSGAVSGKVGRLLITTPGATLHLSPSTLTGKFSKHSYTYLDSQFELNVPAAAFDSQNGGQVSLEDLQFSTTLATVNNRAAGSHHMQTGTLDLAGLTLGSTEFAIKFDLDAQAFSDFFALVKDINQRLDIPLDNSAATESAFIEMVRQGGTVTIEKLEMDIEGSPLHIDMHLDIPPGHKDIFGALQNGQGAGKIILPQIAVDMLSRHSQQIAFMIQMGTGAGFIRKKGRLYTADIKYEDGLLLLNGLPMQMPF